MRNKKYFDDETEEMLDDLDFLLDDLDGTNNVQNDESVSCPDEDEIDEYYDPGDEVGSYFEEHGIEPPDDIEDDSLNTDEDTAEASYIENHGGDEESLEEDEAGNVVESVDIFDDFDMEDENDDAGVGALRYFTGDPSFSELRTTEYRHSGFRCLLATMTLGISLDAPILSNFTEWEKIIKERLDYFFRNIYVPHSKNADTFLPAQFSAYDALNETDKIKHGNPSDTALGKYLASQAGPIIIEIDSLYANYRADSWMVKLWMIAGGGEFDLFVGGKKK